jgi:DNA (cytosine-5)-methyltransferase 1
MAVPPRGAEIIIRAVLKTFAGIEYNHVRTHWEIDEED